MKSFHVYFNFTLFNLSYPIRYAAGGGVGLALLGLVVHGIHRFVQTKQEQTSYRKRYDSLRREYSRNKDEWDF